VLTDISECKLAETTLRAHAEALSKMNAVLGIAEALQEEV